MTFQVNVTLARKDVTLLRKSKRGRDLGGRSSASGLEVGNEGRNDHGAKVDGPGVGVFGQEGLLALEILDLESIELILFGGSEHTGALIEQLEKAALRIHFTTTSLEVCF